jgi:hypothetical protein
MPNVTTDFNSCVANDECAGQCPVGNWCPQGTILPIPCPEHTYRSAVGAEVEQDCDPCPAGFVCGLGNQF